MPHIDARSGEVVIRIVYDGAPEAGKTTNVAKLGTLMSLQRVGAAKKPGTTGDRTEFFDWLDFAGGYLDGRRVRCQLVSVPGQSSLLHRRKYLLEKADAIVFVADSRRGMFDGAIHNFATTVRMVERLAGPVPIGVILQANKQDLPEALSPPDVAKQIGTSSLMPVVGSVASRGDGVMQTFILAVRLATDRVRALLLGDDLAGFEQHSDTPEALFAAMLELEKAMVANAGVIPAGIGTPAVEPPCIEIIAIDDSAIEEDEEDEEDEEAPAASIEIAARHAAEAGMRDAPRGETEPPPLSPPPAAPTSPPRTPAREYGGFVDAARAVAGSRREAARLESMKTEEEAIEAAWDNAVIDDSPAAYEHVPGGRDQGMDEQLRGDAVRAAREEAVRAPQVVRDHAARTQAARLPPLPELPARVDPAQAARERAAREQVARDLAAREQTARAHAAREHA
ncbi:MAG TPA: ADP-ribosylation factor-like protein, partial [Kofleriaceae bacterium]|nr:ADP-ribosylation factor-like protein [Kofleriaceae bacterium]